MEVIKTFVVDDDISILELYKKVFEILGFIVIDTAKNGEYV